MHINSTSFSIRCMTHFLLQCRLSCVVLWKVYVLSMLTFLSFNVAAQDDFKPKFGVVDRADVEMAAFQGDSSAAAVYLYDFGEVTYRYDDIRGLVMVMESWIRIKILKESALDRASVAINTYEGSGPENQELMDDIQGFTYNMENGQLVRTAMDRKSIKREKATGKYYTYKFNLANARKGSVIEYSYRRTTPLTVRDKPSPWTFQASVPSKWSEFRITIPFFLEYKTTMSGYLPLYISEQEPTDVHVGSSRLNGRGVAYRFVVKDAPAFVNEPFITTESDYLSKVNFELSVIQVPGEISKHFSNTWDDVEKTLNEANWFGVELRKSSFLKAKRDEIMQTAKTPEEKMEMAYRHLQSHMKWDGSSFLGSRDGVRKAYENKAGNATEVNLILTSLLRELDLNADPVILSTRSNGRFLKEIPLLESCNYVISHVEVAGKEYFLDATQPYAKLGLLPEHTLNGYGRLIPKKGSGRFLDIKPLDSQTKLEMVNANILPEDGSIKGNYSISFAGYEALRWRDKYVKEADDIYHEVLKKRSPEWKISNIAVKNKNEDLKGAVNVACDFELEDENASPDLFYFNPILAGRWESNPLKSKERIYPLDFTSGMSESFIGNYKLPAGYVLEEMPKAEIVSLPEKAGKFVYQVRQSGDMIQVSSVIVLSKTNFHAEEYHDVKEFFERVVQKHAQPLVIKKKAN
ncbi:protein of unknown function [Dyadobacter psychrophilus]|uniref:DUF3857 domain-containing protein n=2 Tax=Dyadobacter psychrophilus TaxID=651661 RepID=A0A1T5GZ14_9BACT|nr:protein of unknown function [Dyadobacter psychrophilus]